MKFLKTILLCIFLFPSLINAQNTKSVNHQIERNSVSFNLLGSASLLGITYERILSDHFIFEAGVGYVGVGLGTTYYPFQIKKAAVCLYTGIKFSLLVLPEVFAAYGGYVPFGITYFSNRRYNIGIDFGPAIGHWNKSGGHPAVYDPNVNYNDSGNIRVYGNIKIGLRF
jgi:hypothetical protein